MRLRLSLESGGGLAPGSRTEHIFDQRGGVIGRNDDCDWVLVCPHKLISRRHAVITFEQDEFVLYDASSNGVFHNHSKDPIGAGGRVTLRDGDTLLMGEFVIRASLLDAPSSVPETLAQVPPVEVPVPRSIEQRPRPGAKLVSLPEPASTASPEPKSMPRIGGPRDAFRPPLIAIPDDVDLSLEPGPDAGRLRPAQAINQQLNALQPAAARALWQGLLPSQDPVTDLELTPEAARALAESLRSCIEGVVALAAEFEQIERRLSNRKSKDDSGNALRLADVDGFCRGLLEEQDDDERARLVATLRDTVTQMQGRYALVVGCFEQSVNTILDQFAPDKFERRLERQLAEKGKGMRRRIGFRFNRRAAYWDFYKNWYETQRKTVFGAVHHLFEKRIVALYAGRLKGGRERTPEVT